MKISVVEFQKLLSLYKEETGNPTNSIGFNYSDYIEWLENKIIELLHASKC